jgi:tripartite-type tricarboxylate transporter receptor subunit TctC
MGSFVSRYRLFRVSAALGIFLGVAAGGAAIAQDFPSKPVRFITGAAPGSSGDVLARVLGDQVTEAWKQPVVIENRPGAGGAISSQAVLSAPADGHAVFIAAGSYLTVTPATTANLPYDVDRDFTPLAFLAEIPLVIGARPGTPFRTLPELIAYAKANPGKVNYAANTPGTFPNLATEYLSERAQIKLTFVPYKGSAAALQDILGGRLDVAVEGVAAYASAIKAGQMLPLAVTSERRDPTLPNVPSVSETIPGYSAVGFYAALAHAKTPEAMAAKLSADLRAALAHPALGKRYADLGLYVKAMTREEVAAFIKKERDVWGGVVKRTGFAPR